MISYGPKLPLQRDLNDGFTNIKSLKENVKQAFKMLILTNPGERMMLPEYGVGLRTFLFEPYTGATQSEITTSVEEQLNLYLPYITLLNIEFPQANLRDQRDTGVLQVRLSYSVPSLSFRDELDLVIEGYRNF